MRSSILATLLLLLAATVPAPAQPKPTTVIRAARLIDGRGNVLSNGAVAVTDGKIVSVGLPGSARDA